MALRAVPSSQPPPQRFSKATLRITAKNKRVRGPYVVWLAISHRVFWKRFYDEKDAPRSLYDFTSHSSLELMRNCASWKDVDAAVKSHGTDGKSLIVSGRLHGRAHSSMFGVAVDVILTANSGEERDEWMRQIVLRIATAEAFQKYSKELLRSANNPGTVDTLLAEGLTKNHSPHVPNETSAFLRGQAVAERAHTGLQKVDWADKMNLQLGLLTGSISTAVSKGASNVGGDNFEAVANAADEVAKYAKIIPGGVSAAFQLFAVSARLAFMYYEAKRGCYELPGILIKVMDLFECITGVFPSILDWPNATKVKEEEVIVDYVFDVLVATVDLMGDIEVQLVRTSCGQIFNHQVVRDIESRFPELKHKVVTALSMKQRVILEDRIVETKQDLDGVKEDVGDVKQDVDNLIRDVDGVKQNVVVVEQRAETVEQGIIGVMEDFGHMNVRVDDVTREVCGLKVAMTDVENDVSDVRQALGVVTRRFGNFRANMQHVKTEDNTSHDG